MENISIVEHLKSILIYLGVVVLKNKLNCKIIIPFYEDDENFKVLIKKIEEIEETEEIFIIVDNGSSTDLIRDYYYKNNPDKEKWNFLKIKNNTGFGAAVKHASTFY